MKAAVRSARIVLVAIVCGTLLPAADAQQRQDEVVRVNTDLVQTDFMVLDKQGNFVDGLKREQFTLKVDGKQREISFFDRINAGSRSEEAQLAAARGTVNSATKGMALPLDRGRTVMFFLDDFHLSPAGMQQTRSLLTRFVDREMGQNDLVEIASTSGQLGFLQQLTDNRSVLHSAISHLRIQQLSTAKTAEQPPMSEYQAMLIEQEDRDVLGYFIDALIKQLPGITPDVAAEMVRARASGISQERSWITTRTLAALRKWLDQSAGVAGRKILFFVSEGFLLDPRNSNDYDRLQRITAAAARFGIVIYSIDARGLSTEQLDVMNSTGADPSGRLLRANMGEGRAMQDILNVLAADTGGRAFFNNNDLSAAVTRGLKESSAYYLIAWRPDNDEQRNPKYRRIELSIMDRPDLVVRFRRGVGTPPEEIAKPRELPSPSPPKSSTEQIASVLRAPYPHSALPVAISLNYIDSAQYGPTLTTTIRVSTSSLPIEMQGGAPTAILDLAGGVFDDQGKSVSTFNKRFTIRAKSGDAATTKPPENIFYNHFAIVKPGIYQVRIAAVDVKQGAAGSAFQWIEIPNLQSNVLTLSSLVVGEKKAVDGVEFTDNNPNQPPSAAVARPAELNVDHRFTRTSYLRFLTFIYNADGSNPPVAGGTILRTVAANAPDIAVQVQIFRDNEPVITTPLHAIKTEGLSDTQRIPYAAEVLLDTLKPGAYVLQVTAIDRRAKASASQRFSFYVD